MDSYTDIILKQTRFFGDASLQDVQHLCPQLTIYPFDCEYIPTIMQLTTPKQSRHRSRFLLLSDVQKMSDRYLLYSERISRQRDNKLNDSRRELIYHLHNSAMSSLYLDKQTPPLAKTQLNIRLQGILQRQQQEIDSYF